MILSCFFYLVCEIYNNYKQDVNELVPHETLHIINADTQTILSGLGLDKKGSIKKVEEKAKEV
jgi:hypothetical protein